VLSLLRLPQGLTKAERFGQPAPESGNPLTQTGPVRTKAVFRKD
jgi:hypothetical protein